MGKFAWLKKEKKKIFQEYHQCQTVCMQLRPDVLSGLIWVQTFYKADDTRRQRVKHVYTAAGWGNMPTFGLYVSLVYATIECS